MHLAEQAHETLPGYDPGLRVERNHSNVLNSLNTSVSVLINVDQGAGREFDRGDALTGQVVVTPSPRPNNDIAVEKILVDFQQLEMLNRRKKWTTKAASIAKYEIPPDAYPPDSLLKSGYQYTFTFSLVVPNLLRQEGCLCTPSNNLSLHRQLPPTVGTPFEWCDQSADVPDKSIVVAYRIRARVCRQDNSVIGRHYKYIRISPSYPPIHLAPQLYQTNTGLKRSGSLVAKRDQPLTLTFDSAPILFLDRRAADLRLRFGNNSNSNNTTDPLPPIKQVLYKLVAYSTSTHEPIRYYPEIYDTKVHCTKDTFQQARSPEWHVQPDDSLVLRIRLPAEKQGVCPSYFSCFSSRQYRVKVIIGFQGYQTVSTHSVPLIVARARDHQFWSVDENDPCPPYYDETESYKYINLGPGP